MRRAGGTKAGDLPELFTKRGFWTDQIAELCIPCLASFALNDPSGSPADSLFDLDDLSSPKKGPPWIERHAVPRSPVSPTGQSAPDAPTPRE